MGKILGLDLGTNSIGWAVVDTYNEKILGTGVKVFPEGVENLGQGKKEESKNAQRRKFRQIRRQYFRKKLRKIKLLELLIKYEMCPLSKSELNRWKHYDKSKGKAGMQFPSSKDFNAWLKMNPYQLRAEGLERDLTREEFGRILYHLIQRRGFRSNRKVKEEGKISKGNEDNTGIQDANEKIGNDKDYPTLGAYLYDISYKESKPYKRKLDEEGNEQRVRARYTLRQMYIDEFEQLWEKQAQNLGLNNITETVKRVYRVGNPYRDRIKEKGLKKKLKHRIEYLKRKGIKAELTNEDNPQNTCLVVEKKVLLKELLGGKEGADAKLKREDSVLFHQRPLRVQKHLLDECAFERTVWKQNGKLIYQRKKPGKNAKLMYAGKKPCPISHPLTELKRAYEFINNIEYGDRQRLNKDQGEKALSIINSKDKNFNFEKIPEALNLAQEKFNYENDYKVAGNYTHKHVKPLFSKDIWEERSEEIWHCFHFYSDSDKLYEKLCNDYGLKRNQKNEEKIKGELQDDGSRKKAIVLKDGYAGLSLKAIKNVLPFLKEGYKYSDAVLLGGVRNVFGKKWNEIETLKRHNEIIKAVKKINSNQDNKEGESIEEIKSYLKKEFKFDDKALLGLYHHSQDTEKQELQDELDEPEDIRNPIVQQALYELRGIVNSLSDKYLKKREQFAQIKVEMGRDLKNSKVRRYQIRKDNEQRAKENAEARAVLDEYGLARSRTNIHKYLLWKELKREGGNGICPYTGKTISIAALFNDNKFQIEHIIPYSQSLDDSFANKTICDAKENGKKGEKTPFEFYGSDEKIWEEVRERAFKLLPYHKAKRFTSKTAHKTDFIERQLNDTRYISKAAKNYLKQIVDESEEQKVFVFPGQLTASLRRKWGLDSILNPPVEMKNGGVDFGRVWAQFNGNGEAVAFYPIYNKPPRYKKGEFVITGEMKEGAFESKYLAVKFEANGQDDGKYWAKLKVKQEPVKLVQILKPKPETAKNEVLLYGKTDDKEKFITKFISKKIDAKDKDLKKETAYWAKLTVLTDKKRFFSTRDKKIPKPKNNSVLIYGKVKDGVFSSNIYTCEANVEDGKYNALLELDLESVTFHKVKNEGPEVNKGQIRVTGNVKKESFQPHVGRKHFYDAPKAEDGLHWAVFELKSKPHDFTVMENPKPKANGALVEGSIALADVIDEETGEVLTEEEKKYFFPAKQRGDHRHHAIDALVVAMTEQGFLKNLSDWNANKKALKRNQQEKYNEKLKFPIPWNGDFRVQAENQIKQTLVSHKKVSRVLTKRKVKNPKTGKVNEGIGARGQLHEATIYGERYDNPERTSKSYRIRKKLSELMPAMIRNIADRNIREMVFKKIEENGFDIDEKRKPVVKGSAAKKKFKEVLSQPIFLKNTKGGEQVPVKKVRIKVSLSYSEWLKKELKQKVNPGNNHHILIFKDSNGELHEDVVTFFEAVARKNDGQPVIQLPPEHEAGTIVTVLQKNDMYLLTGLAEEKNIDWKNADAETRSKYLYRVEAISPGYYEFRHHLEANQEREYEPYYIRIQSLKEGKTGWRRFNPVKVIVNRLGEIVKIGKKKLTPTGRIERAGS